MGTLPIRTTLTKPLALLAVAVIGGGAAGLAGCGGKNTRTTERTPPPAASASADAGPVPASLKAAESAAEDVIDLALAGDRPKVVAKAVELDQVARGEAGAAALAAGVPQAVVGKFARRAAEVARLAPIAPLLEVAIASNAAFALAPDLFRPFDSPVPVDLMGLDYLDFEAKLRATAGDAVATARVVAELQRAWTALRPQVVAAGATGASESFDAHVAAMKRLLERGDAAALAAEAQHGLDLVDELEQVFAA